MDKSSQETTTSVFIKILDKGFSINVPVSQEKLYREGYEALLARIGQHSKTHLPVEAVALASLDSIVALQRAQNQLKVLIGALEKQMDELDATLLEAL